MREFVWIGLYIGLASLFILLADLALRLLNLRHLFRQKTVFLELTPPASTSKTPEATQKWFAVLHGLEARSVPDRLLRRREVFSLEAVSTFDGGIRYLMRVPAHEAPVFEQHIVSYLPDVKVKQVEDYLPELDYRGVRVLDFKQTGHFAYPLQLQGPIITHDPSAYITGAMTKLKKDEMVVLQVVVSPVKVREADAISRRLMSNEELVNRLGRRRGSIPGIIGNGISTLLFGIMDLVGDVAWSGSPNTYHYDTRRKQDAALKLRPARVLSPIEQELAYSVHEKLAQPLFRVSVRALIKTDSKTRLKQRQASIKGALDTFKTRYQSLKARPLISNRLRGRYRVFAFKHRLPAFVESNATLLAASELADLYHFPHAATAKTENVVKSLSKTLPAPISLKGKTDFDVVLGQNHHHGTTTDIGLTAKDRERHVYIIGGTGNGKTTMIQYSIVQDIQNGKGLAVIDPHGDLAETVLRHIPEDRIKDVIYFNPDDLGYPIGMNLLELTPGLFGDDLLREKDLVTESVISVFRKIFSEDDSGGHRIEYVLRNTIQTALTLESPTLFTVYDLLNDPAFRKQTLRSLEDKDLKNFWKNELGKAGGFQQVKMVAGITAKIGRFLFSASAKRILEQPKSTINFDDVLDSGKILICNFSKGLIGEDTSELFGVTVLAKLQMAALRRARVPQAERRPFYLYVDEFQNFATMSFVQMLSEARKYKLFLVMAEQSVSQQEEQRLVNIILANVGTVICFRSANPADERMVLPMFSPYIQEGEIANLPSFNFYMRIAASKAQEPLSGETLLLADTGSDRAVKRVIEASRNTYAARIQPKASDKKAKPEKAIGSKQTTKAKPMVKVKVPGE